jgi:glycogen debranching enzyme
MVRPERRATADGPLLAASGGHLQPTPTEVPFSIHPPGVESRPRRTLKHNDTFAVFDSHGDIGATAGGPDGLFDHDTRFLSHLELLINGASPLLLGSAIKDNNLNYYVDLTNPDVYVDDRLVLAKDTVHIARTIYLHDGALRERVTVSNHGTEAVQFSLSLAFASDFADIFEVRGLRRKQRGRAWAKVLGPDAVTLSYRGLDGGLREAALSFHPAPTLLKNSIATFALALAPGARRKIFVAASSRPAQERQSSLSFLGAFLKLSRELKAATRPVAAVETSNAVLNEILCQSMADLYMLTTATPDGPYPYAGIPWYSTTFGRDGIITALQMLWVDPAIAAGVLRRLCRYQATGDTAGGDVDPGKILHEMRGGEMAALGEVPFGFYYGSVDATPLFVVLAGRYAERTGDYALMRELWPAVERALAWIDGCGDRDGDGFVEYARREETGLVNQGWKDSHDSIFHTDGSGAEAPIALVEAQGYVYEAKRLAAGCARRLGLDDRASKLEAQAEALRQRFEEAFWCERLGTYALALDRDKRPCEVRTSNAGHVLAAGIARRDRARSVAGGLMQARFFSGWGIRTLAQDEARYNPMSYHNGSIWPHDNALIAQGFARYGFKAAINVIFEALMQAASYMDQRRIPELYCGFQRRRGRGPTLYPVACSPQAWAASAPFSLLQSMLGLEFDHASHQIRLVNPSIPKFAGDIIIRNLSLGESSADIAVRRDGEATSLHVMRASGDLQVSLILNADAWMN